MDGFCLMHRALAIALCLAATSALWVAAAPTARAGDVRVGIRLVIRVPARVAVGAAAEAGPMETTFAWRVVLPGAAAVLVTFFAPAAATAEMLTALGLQGTVGDGVGPGGTAVVTVLLQ